MNYGRPLIRAPIPQLAKKYHPDTNKDPGAQERFVEIQNAYDVRVFPSNSVLAAFR